MKLSEMLDKAPHAVHTTCANEKVYFIYSKRFDSLIVQAQKLEARLEAAELYAMATNGYCECHRYQPSANQSCDSCMLQQKLYEDWQKLVNEVE